MVKVDFIRRQLYNFGMEKKDTFKLLIKEFYAQSLPNLIERELEVPLSVKKVITIYGPRRSGKSFFLYSLIKKLLKQGVTKERIIYLNFEDDRILPLDFKDLNLILEAYFELYPENKDRETFLFFDEIQNIKNWEIFVRRIYEKERVRIFVTGSSSKLLSKEIATSLRGRTISYSLSPLNFREFLQFKKLKLARDFQYTPQRFVVKKMVQEYIEWGGFPEIVLENDLALKKKILSEYFNLLVYRDLAERFSLKNLEALRDLLKFLFTNITATFSVNSYFKATRQKLSLSRDTAAAYLFYIQESQYFSLLAQFSYSLKAQKINPKKIISVDNGLRNTIAFRFSQDEGKLVENLVGNTLIRQGREVFYWKSKREVDFVIKEKGALWAINVSFGREVKERETLSLLEFKNNFTNVKKLFLITKDEEKKEQGISFIPFWKWIIKN